MKQKGKNMPEKRLHFDFFKSLNCMLWHYSLVNFFQTSLKICPNLSSLLANLQEYTQALWNYVLCMMNYPYPLNHKMYRFSILPDSMYCMTFSHHDMFKLTYSMWLGVDKNWISHFCENQRWQTNIIFHIMMLS